MSKVKTFVENGIVYVGFTGAVCGLAAMVLNVRTGISFDEAFGALSDIRFSLPVAAMFAVFEVKGIFRALEAVLEDDE